MIAEGIGEAGDLGRGNAKDEGEQGGEGERNPGGAFELAAQFVGARQSLHRHAAQAGGVIIHRLRGELAGERGEGGIASLGAELQEVDETRAEGRVAGFEKAGDVFGTVARKRRRDGRQNQRACRRRRSWPAKFRERQPALR